MLEAIESLRAALAEPVEPAPGYCKHCKQYTIEEPLRAEPVAGFWLDAKHVNSIVIDSLRKLIARAKWSHTADVELRENGKDVRFEADWIKYMEWRTHPTTPPAADEKVVRLTREQHEELRGAVAWTAASDRTKERLLALLGDWPAQEGR